MRIDSSIKNASCATIKFTVMTILKFVTRIFLIKYLGEKFLGLNGLFSSVISMLSLAELGFGGAIIFSMYKPVADGDEETVSALLNLYKKIYLIVATVILVIGLVLTPFIKVFISAEDVGNLNINVYIVFLIFLVSTVLSYLMSYKRSLLYVNQKNYIEDLIVTLTQIVMGVAQILAIVLFKNYYLYILTMPIFTLAENIVISIVVNKKVPLPKTTKKLPKETLKTIKKNVMAMICHKLGAIVVFATDGMLIAKFIGLDTLGLYSNYTLIITAIASIFSMILSSIGGSVGNSIAIEDLKTNKKTFNQIFYIIFIAIAFCAACLCSLMQPFIQLMFGGKMLLENYVVFLIILSFVISRSRDLVNMYKEKTGLFYNDRFKPLLEAVVNLAVSLLLAYYLGLAGIILGTIISSVCVALPIEAYVLQKNYFKENPLKYLAKYLIALAFIAFITVPTYFLCAIIPFGGFGWFALKMVVAVFCSIILIIATTFWTPQFKKTVSLVKYTFSKVFKRHRKLDKNIKDGE